MSFARYVKTQSPTQADFRQGEMVPTPATDQDGSEEISMKVAFPSRRKRFFLTPAPIRRVKEKERRDGEPFHLKRMGQLFKVLSPKQTWTRVGVLYFGKMTSLVVRFERLLTGFVQAVAFLLCDPGAFSSGFVNVVSV